MFSLNLNINDIVQFLIKNKTMFIPGILYLVFNNLISPYIIAVIIGIYFMIDQINQNSLLSSKLETMENIVSKLNNFIQKNNTTSAPNNTTSDPNNTTSAPTNQQPS